jgi:hypothetical protein
MATTSNAAMRKKTPFYVSIFKIHDTSTRSAPWRQGVQVNKLLITGTDCLNQAGQHEHPP